MSPAYFQLERPVLTSDRGRWYVPVPWDRAGVMHTFLQIRGLPSTLCLDPAVLDARLVLWPGTDPRRVASMLADRWPDFATAAGPARKAA